MAIDGEKAGLFERAQSWAMNVVPTHVSGAALAVTAERSKENSIRRDGPQRICVNGGGVLRFRTGGDGAFGPSLAPPCIMKEPKT